MRWRALTETNQLEDIVEMSYSQSIIIFKHSSRCHVSARVKNHLESEWPENLIESSPYFLDLISFREVSNKVSEKFSIEHQSPQVLVIRDGECNYAASHSDITTLSLAERV